MLTKLTLSAKKEVVEKAKRLAAERHTSVSALFDRYVRSMTVGAPAPRTIGRLTRKATGIIALPPGKKDRPILEQALMDKYKL